MAKRGAFQFRLPPSKMPKLDITITSGQAMAASQTVGLSQMPASSRMPAPWPHQQQQQQPQPAQQSEDIWGDDGDDEMILLASQVADQCEAASQMVISEAMNFTAHNLSYGRFQNEVDTSTQLPAPIKNKTKFAFDDADGFEDLLSQVPYFANGQQSRASEPATAAPMPSTSTATTAVMMAVPPLPAAPPAPSSRIVCDLSKDNTAQKDAQKEAQATYLQKKIRERKKEIDTLKESLSKISEKCQQKEGEASSLRYELGLKEQQIDRLRKEKLTEIGALEKQYTEKVVNLEKTVESQKSELEFRHLDQSIKTKKLSRQTNSFQAAHHNENNNPARFLTERQQNALFQLPLSTKEVSDHIKLNINTFFTHITDNDANTMQSMNGKNPELIARFQSLQTIVLHTGFDNLKRLNTGITQEIIKLIEELTKSMSACVERLQIQQQKEFNPSLEYKLQSESFRAARAGQATAWNVNGSQRRSHEKKMVYESRVLTSMAAICGQFPSVAILLMDHDISSSLEEIGDVRMEVDGSVTSFVMALTDVLMSIANSGNMESHQDFVAASILLLKVLNNKIKQSRNRNHTLFKLFRAIVFCRPDIQLLEPLSQYVETIPSQDPFNGPNRLCSDLKCTNFVNYTNQNIRHYSSDVCPLQIYAVLLEIGVHQYDTESLVCSDALITAIAQIAIRSMNFLRDCLKQPTRWLMAHGADGTANGSNCHCYSLMVTSTIAQLYVVIKRWFDNMNCLDAKMVQTIFKMASIFLHDNFAFENYKTKVLMLGNRSAKNRLQMFYDRIIFCRHFFKLEMAHGVAIKNVNLRRIPQMIEVQSAPLKPKATDHIPDDGFNILNDSFESLLATTRQI